MGKTKELFTEMRLRDEFNYASDFTKKEAQKKGKELALSVLDAGQLTPIEAASKLARFSEVINVAFSELKNNIEVDKEVVSNGVKFQKVQGGKILDYEKDFVWQKINNELNDKKIELKSRQKKLDQAYNESQKIDESERTPILDGDEIVEAIPLKGYKKSYIKILF